MKKINLAKKINFLLFIVLTGLLISGNYTNAEGNEMKTNYIKNRKIMLDPGHGGIDSGAVRFEIKEADLNLKVAKVLSRYLNLFGAEVIFTRNDNNQTIDLNKRYDMIIQKKPDIFISLHHNDTADAGYAHPDFKNRTEVYFGLISDCGMDTITLGKCFLKAFKKLSRIENIVLIPGYFKVIRNSDIPSVLMEPYYMGESDFLKIASCDYYIKHEALCYFNAINEYFKAKSNLNNLNFETGDEKLMYNHDTCDVFVSCSDESAGETGSKICELLNVSSIKTFLNVEGYDLPVECSVKNNHISSYYINKILKTADVLNQDMLKQYILAIMSNTRNPKVHIDLTFNDSNCPAVSYYYKSEKGKKIAQDLSNSIKEIKLGIELKMNPDSFYLLSSTSAAAVKITLSKKSVLAMDSSQKLRLAVAIFKAIRSHF